MSEKLLITGAGIAAIRVIEAARAAGYTGQITLVGAESHLPYERPPLSKQVLSGSWDERIIFPRTEDELNRLDVEFRLGVRAVSLDRELRQVSLDDGDVLSYDKLVIATGSRARELPFDHPPGVHTIRTLEDSLEIAAQLRTKPHVAVVGAGFIGLEVASTARAAGCEVTLIESGRVPLVRALGQTMGVHCAALHESNGVTVLTRGRVVGFTSDQRVTGVVLDDCVLPADLVVVGIGAIPNLEWLEGAGLRVNDGIECDSHGHADSSGTVFAVGDVASWWDGKLEAHVRHEHWTSASEQARHVGRLIAGESLAPHHSIPYFWSDQHGIKIQMAGTASAEDELVMLEGSLSTGRFVAAYTQGEQIRAILAFDSPRSFALQRGMLARGSTLSEVRERATQTQRRVRV